jgi:hypothetical protein
MQFDQLLLVSRQSGFPADPLLAWNRKTISVQDNGDGVPRKMPFGLMTPTA